MPTIDFSDAEHAAVTRAVRRALDDDRYPLAPLARTAQIGAGEVRPGGRAKANGATTAAALGAERREQTRQVAAVILNGAQVS